MGNNETSKEFESIHISNVNEEFTTLIAKSPSILSLIPFLTGEEDRAKKHKHEWLQHSATPLSWTVNGASASGDPTRDIVLDSSVGVKVGDILGFKTSAGASIPQKAKVTAVNVDGVTISVEILTADGNIADNAVVFLTARPKYEGSESDLDSNVMPTTAYNYTQIFRRDFRLTRSNLQTALYGLANEASRQGKTIDQVMLEAEHQLRQISWELNQSVIEGFREERGTATSGDNGTMGGILSFLGLSANSQYDAGAAELSETILNNAIEQAVGNGASGQELTTMLMHSRQARKISKFKTTGTNPVVFVEKGDITQGQYVARYQSDLGGTNGGALAKIVVDRNFPEDQIAIINPNDLAIVPMQDFYIKETTPADYDGRRFMTLGEVTLRFRNANNGNMLVKNLHL